MNITLLSNVLPGTRGDCDCTCHQMQLGSFLKRARNNNFTLKLIQMNDSPPAKGSSPLFPSQKVPQFFLCCGFEHAKHATILISDCPGVHALVGTGHLATSSSKAEAVQRFTLADMAPRVIFSSALQLFSLVVHSLVSLVVQPPRSHRQASWLAAGVQDLGFPGRSSAHSSLRIAAVVTRSM